MSGDYTHYCYLLAMKNTRMLTVKTAKTFSTRVAIPDRLPPPACLIDLLNLELQLRACRAMNECIILIQWRLVACVLCFLGQPHSNPNNLMR